MTHLPAVSTAPRAAVVVADDVGGLLAARVLAEQIEQVTLIIQRREGESPRPVVLLPRERALLATLFPTLLDALRDAGAPSFNLGMHVDWFLNGRWRPHYRSSIEAIGCSDTLLAAQLERQLRECPRLSLRTLCAGSTLRLLESGGRATGVQLGAAASGAHDGERIGADLLVDATRNNALTSGGGQAPIRGQGEVERDTGARYTSRLFQRSTPAHTRGQALFLQPHPPEQPRGVVLLPLEGDRWHVTLVEHAGAPLPTDEAGWGAWLHALPTPQLSEILAAAEPLLPIAPSSPIHPCPPHPSPLHGIVNLIDFGIAVGGRCPRPLPSLSYIAIGCSVLAECLHATTPPSPSLAETFQRRLSEALADHGPIARYEAERWWGLPPFAPRPATTDPLNHYLDRLEEASLASTALLETLHHVQQLLAPSTLLFRPDIVLEAMKD